MVSRSRRHSKLSIALVVAAFIAIFSVSLSMASAKTHPGDRTVWFQDVTLSQGDEITGDLDIVFGSATCDGAVIDGNVRTFFGRFDKQDGCIVQGSVSDAFGNETIDSVAPSWAPATIEDYQHQNSAVWKKLAWDVVVLFAFLLFPMRTRVALDRVELHPGLSFATGTLAIVGAIPIAILLLISVIGLPLIPLEFAALFAGLWIGNAAVALLIGRRLWELLRPHTTPSPLGALALGLLLITAAETLPVVGWAVSALVILVGLGSALLGFVRETQFRSFTGYTPPPPGPQLPRAPRRR